MTQIVLLIAALYFIAVGFHGNAKAMLGQASQDVKGFAPWVIAIVLLGILAANKYTAELGKPFAALFVLSVVIKNWQSIQSTSKQFYSEVTS